MLGSKIKIAGPGSRSFLNDIVYSSASIGLQEEPHVSSVCL